jgi:hypothetical protein
LFSVLLAGSGKRLKRRAVGAKGLLAGTVACRRQALQMAVDGVEARFD